MNHNELQGLRLLPCAQSPQCQPVLRHSQPRINITVRQLLHPMPVSSRATSKAVRNGNQQSAHWAGWATPKPLS